MYDPMSATNLFSRLAGFSQNPKKRSTENFCTELLAYFFNHEPIFRRRFLKVIFKDHRMARPFRKARATTQEALGPDCRVDLVLRSGSRIHLIEVKITAAETQSGRWGQTGKPQVQRYIDLKLGNVTYLTTSDSLGPDVDHRGRRRFRMVKHALFEELYEALATPCLTDLAKMFVEFMEENDMAGPQPFARQEIRRAKSAIDIIQKCQSTLAIVRTETNTVVRRNLKTRSNLTRPTFVPDWVQCYLPKYSKGAVKSVGLSLSADQDGLRFSVWMWGKLDPKITKIRTHLGWEKWDDDERWCCSSIRLHGNRNDVPRMVEHAITASRDLGRAIRRFA